MKFSSMRYFILLCLFVHTSVFAQNRKTDALNMAKGFAKTIMITYPDSIVSKKFLQHMLQDKEGTDLSKRSAVWNYEEAVTLKGIDRLWRKTGDDAYFAYMKKSSIILSMVMVRFVHIYLWNTIQIRSLVG